jgi:hypothetical protein
LRAVRPHPPAYRRSKARVDPDITGTLEGIPTESRRSYEEHQKAEIVPAREDE